MLQINLTGKVHQYRDEMQRKQVLTELVTLIKQNTLKRAYAEGWATGKAYEYHLSRTEWKAGKGKIALSNLVTLFEEYQAAERADERKGIIGLGKKSSISSGQVSLILERVGLSPMYGTREHHDPTVEQKEAMARAIDLPLSATDIAYFVGVSEWVVRDRYEIQKPNRTQEFLFRAYKNKKGPFFITYRSASEIYAAADASFSKEDIAELIKKPIDLVDITLDRREEFTPKIISALQIIRNNQEVKTPY